jgi:hypothetical protein
MSVSDLSTFSVSTSVDSGSAPLSVTFSITDGSVDTLVQVETAGVDTYVQTETADDVLIQTD